MLPGLLLVGLVVGLIARRTPLWLPIAMGVLWASLIAADTSTDSGTLAMAAVLGIANTSVGLLAGRAIWGAEGLVRRVGRS